MQGSQDIELFEPVRPGDRLSVAEVVEDIQEKSGRSGPLVIVTTRVTYTNQRGELVGTCTSEWVFR